MSERPNARGALMVAAGIFMSRVSGLVRQVLIAAYFGASGLADAWTAALRLPAVIQNLLGEGSLSASFIPVYAEFIGRERPDEARKFAGAALGFLMVAGGLLALAGALLAPQIVGLLIPGYDGVRKEATIQLVRVLFPMAGVLVLSAWTLGILNSHKRFLLSYAAPVLWNGAIIVSLLTGALYLGLDGVDLLIAGGWGALIGGVLQLAVQLPSVIRHMGAIRPTLDPNAPGLREAGRNFMPVVGARGFESFSGFLREVTLAGLLAQGSVAILGFVQPFYLLPISLFGLSVAAAELPELSKRRDQEPSELAARIGGGLHAVQYWVVPTAVAYAVLGRELMTIAYQRGRFTADDATVAHYVLGALAVGLLASASSRLLSNAFYALRDTKTPAKVAVYRIIVSFGMGAALMFPFDTFERGDLRLGAVGLAIGAATAAWMEYTVLRVRLSRRLGPHGPGVEQGIRVWSAAALAAAAGWATTRWATALPPLGVAFLALGIFGVTYLTMTRVLGVNRPGRSSG